MKLGRLLRELRHRMREQFHARPPVILHVGLHKTATTTLQDFLSLKSAQLAAAGVAYPPLDSLRPWLTRALQGNWDSMGPVRELVETHRDRTLIISEENILGSAYELMHDVMYRRARIHVEKLVHVAHPRTVYLFLTLRRPSKFIPSLYCEYIRHNPFITFDRFLERVDFDKFRYSKTFAWIAELPVQVRPRIIPFEEDYGGGLRVVAETMLETACGAAHGIDLADIPKMRSRATVSAEALDQFAVLARDHGPERVPDLIKAQETGGQPLGSSPFAPFPPERIAELDHAYEQDLRVFGIWSGRG